MSRPARWPRAFRHRSTKVGPTDETSVTKPTIPTNPTRKATDGAGHQEAVEPLRRLGEPGAVTGDRRKPARATRRHQAVAVRQRGALLPLRGECARRGRVRRAELL